MAIFEYKAKNQQGGEAVGVVMAPSENVAYGILKDKDLVVINLKERKKSAIFQSPLKFLKRVKAKEIVIFSRQFAVMISASVPIVRALRVLVKQTENAQFKSIISDMADEVDGGAKLSWAMGKYPHVFSNFFIHMVRSAETTGRLDEILNYLADQAEKDYDLIGKVKGAMTYPAFILTALIAVAFMLMIFVMPQLIAVFKEGNAQLPITTRMLIWVSDFLRGYWWAIFLAVIGIIVGFRFIIKSPTGRNTFDMLKLRAPILGNIYNRIYLNRFARSLATLLASGVPLAQSLQIVADVVGNVHYNQLILSTIKEVESGNSITTVFAQSKIVPVMLSQMMSIGEQSGQLDGVLNKVADFYARELANLLNNLVSLIEPVIMVIMGVGVAVLISAILLPIYNLSSAI